MTYLAVCAISVLFGRGVLRLIGLPLDSRSSTFLAPVVSLSVWTLLVGLLVQFGLPVKEFWLAVWLISLALSLDELHRLPLRTLTPQAWKDWLPAVAVVGFPVVALLPFFWYGLASFPGSSAQDGWSYIACGQSLWEYPSGADGGLAPLHQYAAHLRGTRFITYALLGVLSPLAGTRGDAQAAAGLLAAWSVFVFTSGCAFLSWSRRMGILWTVLYLFFASVGNWITVMFSVNNYDNALILGFLPALVGVSALIDPEHRRWSILVAFLGAACLVCYPEMAVFNLGCTALLVIERTIKGKDRYLEWLGLAVLGLVLMGFLLLPSFGHIISFFKSQATSGFNRCGPRPGEGFFPDLLVPSHMLAAFWGFLGGWFDAGTRFERVWILLWTLCPFILSAFAVVGLYQLLKARDWAFAATIVLLCVAAFIFVCVFRYSYGAYKFILLNSWGLAFLVVLGLRELLNRLREKWRIAGWAVVALLVGTNLFSGARKAIALARSAPARSIDHFSQVRAIQRFSGDRPVVVAVDEGFSNAWAVYFLRDLPVILAEYRGYMGQAHVVPFMDRVKSYSYARSQLVLSDNSELPPAGGLFRVIWSGGPYRLLQSMGTRWTWLSSIHNLNGLENTPERDFFWLGEAETVVTILANHSGHVELRAEASLGPSVPQKTVSRLRVTSGDRKRDLEIRPGPFVVTIPVCEGKNRVTLLPLDTPTLRCLPNGDTRPLLLGLRNLHATVGPDPQSHSPGAHGN